MIVEIKVEREMQSLRDVIGNRQEMRTHGHWIVEALLSSLIELNKLKICLRAIQPKTISISLTKKKLIFCDTRNLVRLDEDNETQYFDPAPYSA